MELKSLLKVRYTHFQKVRAKKIRVVSRAQKPQCPASGWGGGGGVGGEYTSRTQEQGSRDLQQWPRR